MKPLFLLFTAFTLTACGTSHTFSESDLTPALYKGYWAMTPIDDVHRVIKFHRTGTVKIYDYDCEHESYRLNGTETAYLSKEKKNVFTLLDEKKKPFARFEITRVNATTLQAKEQFLDKKIAPNTLYLSYTNYIGAKPICYSTY